MRRARVARELAADHRDRDAAEDHENQERAQRLKRIDRRHEPVAHAVDDAGDRHETAPRLGDDLRGHAGERGREDEDEEEQPVSARAGSRAERGDRDRREDRGERQGVGEGGERALERLDGAAPLGRRGGGGEPGERGAERDRHEEEKREPTGARDDVRHDAATARVQKNANAVGAVALEHAHGAGERDEHAGSPREDRRGGRGDVREIDLPPRGRERDAEHEQRDDQREDDGDLRQHALPSPREPEGEQRARASSPSFLGGRRLHPRGSATRERGCIGHAGANETTKTADFPACYSRPVLALLRRHPSLLPALAAVSYLLAVSATHEGTFSPRVLFCAFTALALAILGATAKERPLQGTLFALAISVAVLLAREPTPVLSILALAAGALSSIAARRAITLVPSLGGLAARDTSPSWSSYVLAPIPWVIAIGLTIAKHSAAPAVALGAGPASIVLFFGTLSKHRLDRRHELGAAERLGAGAQIAIAGVLVGVAFLVVDAASLRTVALVTPLILSVVVALALLRGEPVAIARGVRRAVTLSIVGGGIVILAAVAAASEPVVAGVIVLVAVVLALFAGHVGALFEGPLLPAAGALLHAIDEATASLLRSSPDEALPNALRVLRRGAGPDAPPAELWTLSPQRVLTVDAAGYPHERDAELPTELVAVAKQEPLFTLRTAVLVALEVRRPALRPLARWLDDRNMLCAVLVTRDREVDGVLIIPRGHRVEPLSLEEAKKLEELAARLAGAAAGKSALARSLDREQAATRAAAEAEGRAERFEHELHRERAAHVGAAARLARPATVGIYAAASRLAYDALERATKQGAPIVVVAKSGVDPVPYIARAHLAGSRKDGPLVVVDGTATREHDLERWRDPTASPLALADKGVLVLVDGAALPLDVQRLVGQALAERRSPWERAEPLDVIPYLTSVPEPQTLEAEGRLDTILASRFGQGFESAIRLPGIAERPEDIRAILTDRLAREGLRVRGRPLGIDDAAFAILVEHPFEGEDAELAALVHRMVAICSSDVVGAEEVKRVLPPPTQEAQRRSRRPKSIQPPR